MKTKKEMRGHSQIRSFGSYIGRLKVLNKDFSLLVYVSGEVVTFLNFVNFSKEIVGSPFLACKKMLFVANARNALLFKQRSKGRK